MPTRGYDEEAAKIGLSCGSHPRRTKLILLKGVRSKSSKEHPFKKA
jgi:hypothetical protein